jgi:uncharacterized protein YqhQ
LRKAISGAGAITQNGAAVFAAAVTANAEGSAGGDAKKTSVGGQALIEGLLMIGPRKVAIAVRKPNGEIELKVDPLRPKSLLQKIPLIRGVVNLFRQMAVGIGALMYSAEFFELEDEDVDDNADGDNPADGDDTAANLDAAAADVVAVADDGPSSPPVPSAQPESSEPLTSPAQPSEPPAQPSRFEAFLTKKFGDKAKDAVIYLAVAFSLCLSVGLFILLPNFIASFLPFDKSRGGGLVLSNLCEGLIRVGIFLGYLALSSRMNEIRRLWQYHGAEHKTIHCYEHGDALTVEHIRKYSTKHPRCGTSFLFLVMILSILVFSVVDLIVLNLPFTLVGVSKILFSLLVRLVTIPVVAGVAYEIIKLAGRYDNAATRLISAPGLMFQRFTTKEPEDAMIEVAIVAFENALSDDENEMRW